MSENSSEISGGAISGDTEQNYKKIVTLIHTLKREPVYDCTDCTHVFSICWVTSFTSNLHSGKIWKAREGVVIDLSIPVSYVIQGTSYKNEEYEIET